MFANASKALLISFFFPQKSNAYIDRLFQFPESFKINLLIILHFRVNLKYKSLFTFILLENLDLILQDSTMIKKNLYKDLSSSYNT